MIAFGCFFVNFCNIFFKKALLLFKHMEFDKYRKYNENIKDMMSTLTRRRAQFNIYTSNSLVECALTCGGG